MKRGTAGRGDQLTGFLDRHTDILTDHVHDHRHHQLQFANALAFCLDFRRGRQGCRRSFDYTGQQHGSFGTHGVLPSPMSGEFSDDRFVTVFSSRRHNAEVEAKTVHGLLESAGLRSLIARENVPELPVGKVSVRVLASDAEEAEELIRNALEAGESDSLGDSAP